MPKIPRELMTIVSRMRLSHRRPENEQCGSLQNAPVGGIHDPAIAKAIPPASPAPVGVASPGESWSQPADLAHTRDGSEQK